MEFPTVAKLPIENGVGTVGFAVRGANGTLAQARTTSGIIRLFQGDGYGIYAGYVVIDDTAAIVVWDDAAGNAAYDGSADFDWLQEGAILSSVVLPTASEAEVGYTIYDADGQEIASRSTTGVLQTYSGTGFGIYQVQMEIPDGVESGIVVFDDDDGNATFRRFAAVESGPPQPDPEDETTQTIQFNVCSANMEMIAADQSPVLSSPTSSYGVSKLGSSTVIVADSTPMSVTGVRYEYSFTREDSDQKYRYYIEAIIEGTRYFIGRTTQRVSSANLVFGRYTDSSRIEQKFGADNLHLWLALDDSDEPVDYSFREWSLISDAERYIDERLKGSFIGGAFTDTIPGVITQLATELAGVLMYENRGVIDTNAITGQAEHKYRFIRNRVEDQLRQIKYGKLLISDTLTPTRSPSIPCE